jgi:hypothetical protein
VEWTGAMAGKKEMSSRGSMSDLSNCAKACHHHHHRPRDAPSAPKADAVAAARIGLGGEGYLLEFEVDKVDHAGLLPERRELLLSRASTQATPPATTSTSTTSHQESERGHARAHERLQFGGAKRNGEDIGTKKTCGNGMELGGGRLTYRRLALAVVLERFGEEVGGLLYAQLLQQLFDLCPAHARGTRQHCAVLG